MKKIRSATLESLGVTNYGERSALTSSMLGALAGSHPRQFWKGAKIIITGRWTDTDYAMLRAFSGHEVLLRAGLRLAVKQSYKDGMGGCRALTTLLSMTLALPGQTAEFQRLRVASTQKSLITLSASDLFKTLSGPAMAGHAEATLALAQLMPDENSPDPQQARRHRYGQCGFFNSGLHDPSANANAKAEMHARINGMPLNQYLTDKKCTNAFFWIAHQAHEARLVGSFDANVWEAAGTLLVSRCPAGVIEGDNTLAIALGSKVWRDALKIVKPQLQDASFRFFNRKEVLLKALLEAPGQEVAEILDYVAPGPASKPASKETVLEWATPVDTEPPGWALALLAGHAPNSEWMPKEESISEKAFKIPLALVSAAKAGELTGRACERWGMSSKGSSFNASKLCKALGYKFEAPGGVDVTQTKHSATP